MTKSFAIFQDFSHFSICFWREIARIYRKKVDFPIGIEIEESQFGKIKGVK